MKIKTTPLISVVIATLNRTKYLEKCLTAILSNSYQKYEIIIVDQGKDDRTKFIVKERFSSKKKVKYVHTDTIGLSHARNLGWELSSGDIIAFIDDDAIPVKGWLEAYASVFTEIEPSPAIAGGKIEPMWEAEKPKWYPKEREFLLATYDIGDDIKPFPENALPIGANFAVQRTFLDAIGGFDNRVGFNDARKNSMIAGEDTLIGLRAREAGYTLIYQPNAMVYHHIGANKLTRKYFLRRHYWEGITQIALLECQCNLNQKALKDILYWHFYNILKEASRILYTSSNTNQGGSPKPMLHLAMVMVSLGISVKSLQLLFNKEYIQKKDGNKELEI